MLLRLVVLGVMLLGLGVGSIFAANPDDFFGMQYHIDQSASQDDPISTIVKSPTLSEGLKVGLAYFGVDPKVANIGVELVKKVVLSGGGNDITQHYYAPAGYALCAAWMGVHSITEGANIAFIFDPAGNFAIGAKTPAKAWSKGGQWIEADVKVLFVKSHKAQEYRNQGVCFSTPVTPPNERYQCGESNRCQEFHFGHAYKISATPGNYLVKN